MLARHQIDVLQSDMPTLAADLSEVASRMVIVAGGGEPFLTSVAEPTISGATPGLHAALALTAGAFGTTHPTSSASHIGAAAAVELANLGAVLHEVVIDTALGSGHAEEAQANSTQILVGDFLLARAAELAAAIAPEVARVLAVSVARRCSGAVRELNLTHRPMASWSEHLEIIGLRDGELLAAACRSGVLVTGGRPEIAEQLTTFGRAFGTAARLQIDGPRLAATYGTEVVAADLAKLTATAHMTVDAADIGHPGVAAHALHRLVATLSAEGGEDRARPRDRPTERGPRHR